MRQSGTLLGLWIVRTGDTSSSVSTLLARVQEELYVLAFSSALRAAACRDALGAGGCAFYVCSANLAGVLDEARAAGARGFIVDYDAAEARFASAHALPATPMVRELR
jgi:hypothetical protein